MASKDVHKTEISALNDIVQLLSSGGGGDASAANTLTVVTATAAGTIPAGHFRGSALNIGTAAAIVAGQSIPVGVQISWDQVNNIDTYNAVAYDATGTTLLIEYTI